MEEHLGRDGLSRRDILVKSAGAFCAAGQLQRLRPRR